MTTAYNLTQPPFERFSLVHLVSLHLTFIVFLVAMVFLLARTCWAQDIKTKNGGEAAMVTCLREALDQESKLRGRIVLGAGVNGAKAFQEPPPQVNATSC